jgi:CTP:molybdopterin cytidylyltransferase MocA
MGEPKALLRLGARTFLEVIAGTAQEAGIEPVIVVVGSDGDNIRRRLNLPTVTWVRTQAPEAGPLGSIQGGIRALLNRSVEGALVWHVDQPHVRAATIRTLLASLRGDGPPIALPLYQARRGHPILFGRSVFPELLSHAGPEGARGVVRADPRRVLEVPVDDPAVLEDINTREQYVALLRRLGGDQEQFR